MYVWNSELFWLPLGVSENYLFSNIIMSKSFCVEPQNKYTFINNGPQRPLILVWKICQRPKCDFTGLGETVPCLWTQQRNASTPANSSSLIDRQVPWRHPSPHDSIDVPDLDNLLWMSHTNSVNRDESGRKTPSFLLETSPDFGNVYMGS